MPSFSALTGTLLAIVGLAAAAASPGSAAGIRATGLNAAHAPERVLYSFRGNNDGDLPSAALLADGAGGFFGTTQDGGGGSCGGGCGTVFHLEGGPKGFVEHVLHRFTATTDGTSPEAGLVADGAGALYGTAAFGGSACFNPGCGIVFKLTPEAGGAYDETILYAFTGGADGGNPTASLLIDARGDLVGTTTVGGSGTGVVFELTRSGNAYHESVLHAFGGKPNDGSQPSGSLVVDAHGALYGLTQSGGSAGDGAAYALLPSKNGYAEKVLYSFTGGLDGASPGGALALGPSGVLYGTAYSGGQNDAGVVFSLALKGNAYVETPIHDFAYAGAEPAAGVYVDAAGTLYGTTAFGGLPGCANGGGCGLVFSLTPANGRFSYEILHMFGGGRDGSEPLSTLIAGPNGALFATTLRGGTSNFGTVYRVK